jgi:hypothetical protein
MGSSTIVYYGDMPVSLSSSDQIAGLLPDRENDYLGFRIASIPEPATILLLTLGGIILRKKRI